MSSRKKYILFSILAILIAIAPIISLVCVRRNVWFIKKNSIEISFGAILAIITTICMLKGYLKKFGGIVWCGILLLITYFLRTILTDAYMIFACAFVGLVVSYPFKQLADKNKHIYEIVRDEYYKTEAREKALIEINKSKGV